MEEVKKGWLCMNPVQLDAVVAGTTLPAVMLTGDVLRLLAIYKTKTAAWKVHGRKAQLLEVLVPSKPQS